MFSFFKKFKYETIGVRHFSIKWIDNNDQIEQITYVFKVNGFGKRKVKIHAYGNVKRYGYDKNNTMYHETVLPWLNKDPKLKIRQKECEEKEQKILH